MDHVRLTNRYQVREDMSKEACKSPAIKTIVLGAVVLMLSACSSGGGGTPATPVTNNETEIADTNSGANTDTNLNTGAASNNQSALAGTWGYCGSGFLLGYQFTADRWKDVRGLFTSPDCTGPYEPDSGLHEFEFEGTYEIVGTGTSDSGLPVMLINMTSDALEGVPVFESAQVTRYSIVYTGTAGQLIFGEFTRNESARPTELDFDLPYSRR